MGVSHIKLTKRAADHVIQLSIVGFELQSKTAIELFFMQHQQHYALVPVEQADVIVFDMEHPAVKPLIEKFRAERPMIAVTATDKQFLGCITLHKPLEGKRLIKAITQALEQFAPGAIDPPAATLTKVRNAGEQAFQAYQTRLAAERQAIADYRAQSSDRSKASADVRQRFVLTPDATAAVKPVSADTQAAAAAATLSEVASVTANTLATESPVDELSVNDVPESDEQAREHRTKLTYQMVYECCGNAPDVNLHEPDQRRRVFFKKDSTLLAMLLEVRTEGKARALPMEIVGLPGTLAFLPESKQFLFDFSDDFLIPLALTRFGYQELTLKVRPDLDAERPGVAGAKVTIINSDELVWKLALWTSKGRLDRMLDPDKPYRLSQALDFDRLLPIPHATTISSLWGRHSLSAIEVVKVLKIHQRYVFAFMTAAYAVGAFK